MLKKLSGFIKLGGMLIIVSVMLIAISMLISKSNEEKLSELPVLTDQTMVQAAMDKSPEKYIVMNVPISGDTCKDKLGILVDDYVYLQCQSYYFKYRSRPDDGETYDTNWDSGENSISASEKLYVYGSIPVEQSSYKPYVDYVTLSSESVKFEYVEHIFKDNSVTYYYPDAIENTENNVRYAYRGIKQGQNVTFIALVGDGKIVLSSLYDKDIYPISDDDDMSSIEFSQDERDGALGLAGFVAFALGLFLVMCGIFDTIINCLKKEKKCK